MQKGARVSWIQVQAEGPIVPNCCCLFPFLQGYDQDCPTPTDPLPLFLAQVYAQNHATMRLNNNEGFKNGTVRGAAWYTVLGGMQASPRHALHVVFESGGQCLVFEGVLHLFNTI
jgi:hypothetical protein